MRVPVVGLLAVGEVRFDVEFEAAVTPPSMVKLVVNKKKCIYGEGREGKRKRLVKGCALLIYPHPRVVQGRDKLELWQELGTNGSFDSTWSIRTIIK